MMIENHSSKTKVTDTPKVLKPVDEKAPKQDESNTPKRKPKPVETVYEI